MGGGPRHPDDVGGDLGAGHRGPVLGRLRRVVRRSEPEGRPSLRADPPEGRRAVRHPRTGGEVHRRSTAETRQRILGANDDHGERRDAEPLRSHANRRDLSPLLQHAEERISGFRRDIRRRPPLPIPPGTDRRGSAHADEGRAPIPHLPRRVLPGTVQPNLRRTPGGPVSDPRRAGRRDGEVPRPRVLLRRGRRPHVALLVGRLALDAIFLAHGWPKMKDIQKTIGFVKGTGWPGGATFAVLFSLLEFFGAIALILGLLTQFVAFLFFLEMIATTIFSKTKLNKKFILGYELDVAYAAFALVLALLGPGGWSLDRILGLA